MRTILAILICATTLTPMLASAESNELANATPRIFSRAASDAAFRARVRFRTTSARSQQQPQRPANWIGRHPVLFGALVGGGIGAAVGAATFPEGRWLTRRQNAVIGAGIFAGIGALIGVLVL